MSGGSVQVDRIQDQMQQLKLVRTATELPQLLQEASKKELVYTDLLEELFSRELATGRFIADADNVLLLGPPGVGKTHLAVGLGLKACALGYRTAFTTASGLITTLIRAHQENRIEEKLKQLVQPKLLIIDEIGYLPLERLGANLFFQLVSRRYERGAILITSNQSLTGWGQVFGDQIIATAILDRLLHHSTIVNVKGDSYRLKQKRKAGLLTRSEPFTAETVEAAQG